MIFVSLPDKCKPEELVFYLAMEEYLAAHLDEVAPSSEDRELFFLWQVPPTVIFGRNQVMEAEVNVQYCRSRGIRLYRRKSGGGCVYSDSGNIMLSYVSGNTDVSSTFGFFIRKVTEALKKAGLPAETSGRNDVLVDGRKVSGNAFFLLPGSGIVHGTMLFDSDFAELEKAITPSAGKIASKGVDSVRRHVTNLKPYFENAAESWQRELADIGKFKEYLISEFCGGGCSGAVNTLKLTGEQVDAIIEKEQEYLNPSFLEGRKHSYSVSRWGRIPGVGEIRVDLDMNAGRISGCHLSGDYFSLKEGVDSILSGCLKDAPDNREDVGKRLESVDISGYVAGLDAEKLLNMLYNNNNTYDQYGRESQENLSV